MITLKNDEQIFEAETFLELYLKKKEPDCILYSKEGVKFNVHKEILYQTKLMKNILLDDHGQFSQSIEIFCPCSDKEIESILNFLYNGSISCYQEDEVSKILNNLTKLFGFPGKLFTVEDRSMWNNSSSIKVEKSFHMPDEYFEDINDRIKSSNQHFKTNGSRQNVKRNPSFVKSIIQNEAKIISYSPNTGISAPQILSDFNEPINRNEAIDPLSSNFESVAKTDTVFIPFNPNNCKLESFEAFDADAIIIPPKGHYTSIHEEKKLFECGTCNKKFTTKAHLKRHNKVKHSTLVNGERKPFQIKFSKISNLKSRNSLQCPLCDKTFLKKWEFQNHTTLHHGNQCNLCEKRFMTKIRLFEHNSIIHEGNNQFQFNQCHLCGKTFNRKRNMMGHVALNHCYPCQYCDKKFVKKVPLEIHISSVHEEKSNMTKPHSSVHGNQCNICDKIWTKKRDLRKHLSRDHTFQCDSCDKRFVKKAQLIYHKSAYHDGKKFNCDLCRVNFASELSLNSHISLIHDVNNPNLCKLCNKEFGKLRGHIISKHEKPLQCKNCNRKFTKKQIFQFHDVLEHPHKCSRCELKFVKLSQLKKHSSLFHNAKKPFQCKYCAQEFYRMSTFKVHSDLDHLYECSECDLKFSKNVEFKKHNKLIHKETQPFRCHYCDKKFMTKSYMKSHASNEHSYQCDLCEKKFIAKIHLKTHNSDIHKINYYFEHKNKLQENSSGNDDVKPSPNLQSV